MKLIEHMSETDLQDAIVNTAHLTGWRIHHTRPARLANGQWRTPIQGHKGFPDLVLARDGELILAELKSATGKLSPDQEAWIAALPDIRVWRPSDLPEITRTLSAGRVRRGPFA